MNHHHDGHAHDPAPDLTRNQSLVLGALRRATGPLSAYTILDQLRDEGLRAPLQVYRALDKLVASGSVHRLESLNAFIACSHPGCDRSQTIAFAICERCANVTEFADERLAGDLEALAARDGFALRKTVIELRGTCSDCSKGHA